MGENTLLYDLVNTAEQIRRKYNRQEITAPMVIMAAAEICRTRYTGFTKYENMTFGEQFEEERLRMAFSIAVSARPIYAYSAMKRMILKHRDEYTFDFLPKALALGKEIDKQRKKRDVTAETLLLLALASLPEEDSGVLLEQPREGLLPIAALLKQIDSGINNYVINELNFIVEKLNQKIKSTSELMNWKPEKEFCNVKEFAQLLKDHISYVFKGNELCLTIKDFFGGEQDLNLSIVYVDEVFYVHDNGGAINYLKKHIPQNSQYLKYVYKVCSKKWVIDDRIHGFFSYHYNLMHYLCALIFVANADLVADKMTKQKYARPDGAVLPNYSKAESFSPEAVIERFVTSIAVSFDTHSGTDVSFMLYYPEADRYAKFNIVVQEEGLVRIRDSNRQTIDSSIFGAYYSYREDIDRYKAYINKVGQRFGAEYDGEVSIVSIVEYGDVNEFVKAFIKFVNAAILLSEFGNKIDPDK